MLSLTIATIVALLFSHLALSAPSFGFFDSQHPIQGGLAKHNVPGDNPLTFCESPSTDILTIESVDLTPNPPVPGKNLTIVASGVFHEDVEEGAKVMLQVKYGLIRLINQEADLCEQIENVDMHCPLEKGKMTLSKEVALPNEIPPGKYTVLADVYTKDKDRITCLEAQVTFQLR